MHTHRLPLIQVHMFITDAHTQTPFNTCSSPMHTQTPFNTCPYAHHQCTHRLPLIHVHMLITNAHTQTPIYMHTQNQQNRALHSSWIQKGHFPKNTEQYHGRTFSHKAEQCHYKTTTDVHTPKYASKNKLDLKWCVCTHQTGHSYTRIHSMQQIGS